MPLLSDGPLIPRPTPTARDLDEWAAEHYPHAHPAPAPAMTREQMVEALDRLARLADLVGYVPAEVMAGLKVTIARRDDASLFWLRLLRSIDDSIEVAP